MSTSSFQNDKYGHYETTWENVFKISEKENITSLHIHTDDTDIKQVLR